MVDCLLARVAVFKRNSKGWLLFCVGTGSFGKLFLVLVFFVYDMVVYFAHVSHFVSFLYICFQSKVTTSMAKCSSKEPNGRR